MVAIQTKENSRVYVGLIILYLLASLDGFSQHFPDSLTISAIIKYQNHGNKFSGMPRIEPGATQKQECAMQPPPMY